MIVRELINKIGFRVDESALRKAENSFNSLVRKAENAGRKMTLFITAPFVGLGIWVGKTLSEFEQLDVAFATMLGSTEKADDLVRKMLNFAAKTPFEIKEIGPTVKQLLAVGIESEKVLGTLKSLGDVAAGLSIPVSRLALNFGQIKTQGKLTGRELRDFSVAGVPLIAELAKMLGVTEKAIAGMVSKGSIGFKEVEQAFITMTSAGGRFENLMDKQSKTLGGMWSNLLDNITLVVKAYQKQLIPMFKGIVKALLKITSHFKDEMSPTLKKTLFFIAAMAAATGPLILAFTALIRVGMFVRTTLLAIGTAARLANMSTSLFMLKFALMGAAVIASVLLAIGIFEDIMIFFKGGDSLLGRLIKKLDKWNEAIKNMGAFTLDHFMNMFKSLNDLVQSFMDTLVGTFTGKWKFALDSLINMFKDAFMVIGNLLSTFLQAFIDPINRIFGTKLNIAKMSHDLAQGFSKISSATASAVPSGLSHLRNIGARALESTMTPVPVGAGSSIGLAGQQSLNTTINLTLPNNPSTEQIDAVSSGVEKTVSEALRRASRSIVNALPETE